MSFKRGLVWTAAGQASLFAIQFGGTVIVARLLSPYEMGVFALALAIVGVLNIIQSVGLGSYIVREPDLTTEKIATAFTVNAVISLALAGTIAALGLFGTFVSHDPGVRQVLLVLALTPLLNILSIIPLGMLERSAEFKTISLSSVVSRIALTVVTVVLAYAGYSYFSVAWGQCAAVAVNTVILCVAARRHLSFRVSLAGWRDVGGFGMQMLAITGVNTIGARISDLLLGKMTGLVALGLYNRASNINNLFWENLHIVMGRVVFAEFSRQKREGMSLRGFYLNVSAMVTASLWPVFTGLAVLSAPLVHLVYGARWLAAAPPFAILALSAVIQIAITMTWEIFVACGETARQARMEFIRTGVGTALFAIGCTISLEAAAAARVAEAVFTIFFYGPHLRRMTDTTLHDMGQIYLRSGLLTLLAVSPAMVLVARAGAQARDIGVQPILVSVLAGIMLWGVGLVLMRHPIVREARILFRARFASAAPAGSGL